jgi:hypothetical protein
LWESRKFEVSDCHPIQEGDTLKSEAKRGNFCRGFSGAVTNAKLSYKLCEVRWQAILEEVGGEAEGEI